MRQFFEKIAGIDTKFGITITFFVSLVIASLYKSNAQSNDFSVLIAGTSFLFGILIAFLITNSQSNLSRVNEIIKSDEANWLSLYELSGIFGKEIQNKVRELLDKYLIDQIDYYLKDFKYSAESFMNLYKYIMDLDLKTDKESLVYQNLLSILSDSAINRKKVETFVQDKMLNMEWIIILILLVIQLFFIFYFNSGSLISILLSSVLSTAAVALVLVLRDMDNLKRKEDVWIWEPLSNLFHLLELLPYYPISVVKGGRAKIKKGERIRVAKYSDVYPDMTNKKVEEMEFGKVTE